MKQKNGFAFTLVELIVVISILSILWSIAFFSFQGYARDSRDIVRVTDLSSISRAITLKIAEGWYAPLPESKVDVIASGAVIMHQGKFTQNIGKNYGIFGELKDPLNGRRYSYTVDVNLLKHEVAGFLEGEQAITLPSPKERGITQSTFLSPFGGKAGWFRLRKG